MVAAGRGAAAAWRVMGLAQPQLGARTAGRLQPPARRCGRGRNDTISRASGPGWPVQVPQPEAPQEPIVLDGSNIARAAARDGFGELVALTDALADAGWSPLVVVDASLRHRLGPHDQEELEARLMEGWFQVPKGSDADAHILAETQRLDAWVVSADQFRDHPQRPRRRLDPRLLRR